jgi:hypothetical protein
MIHTQAHRNGQSSELKGECLGLLDILKNDLKKTRKRPNLYLRFMSNFHLNIILIHTFFALIFLPILYKFGEGLNRPGLEQFASESHFFLTTMCLIMVTITSFFSVYLSEEIEEHYFQKLEVSATFYGQFTNKAALYNDLPLAVDGHEILTNKDAKNALSRLISRLDHETELADGSASQETTRKAFQEFSLSDKSQLSK